MNSHILRFPLHYKAILNSISDGVYYVDTNRIINFWNKGAERITGYTSAEVTGLSCRDNILVHVDDKGENLCTGGCPITTTLKTGQPHTSNVYLHHKDGHRVPVTAEISPLRDKSGTILGAVEVFRINSSENDGSDYIENLKKAVLLDFLTELPNRRYLESKILVAFDELRRYKIPFGILFADIDHFKAINDTYGHSAGDEVLRMVASTLRYNIRRSDMAGRWGGEEFVALITHVSDVQLLDIAEKIRALTRQSFVDRKGGNISVTITIGAAMASPEDTPESLLERADNALYRGKADGRNRVIAAPVS